MNLYQSTLAKEVKLSGIGLHSGSAVELRILPARAGTGIVFRRTDSRGAKPVKASVENVSSTELCTILGQGADKIATVEHLLSALAGLSIDNAEILVNGPELPILDGSAEPFVEALLESGLRKQNVSRRFLIVKREFQLRDGDRFIRVEPSHRFSVNYSIEFPSPVIGRQVLEFNYSRSEFRRLAQARTFCHMRDVEQMHKAGLARGGSLDNAVVVDDERVINEHGLRSPDEFVRHKLLDFIGDLYLLQSPLIGRITVERGGHLLHTNFVKQLRLHRNELLASIEPAIAVDNSQSNEWNPLTAVAQFS